MYHNSLSQAKQDSSTVSGFISYHMSSKIQTQYSRFISNKKPNRTCRRFSRCPMCVFLSILMSICFEDAGILQFWNSRKCTTILHFKPSEIQALFPDSSHTTFLARFNTVFQIHLKPTLKQDSSVILTLPYVCLFLSILMSICF